MQSIRVESNPTRERLEGLKVFQWPVWSKDVSEFPWQYDEREICYFLEGDVDVTPVAGESVNIKKGDLATFPAGMSCTWKVNQPVKKHYQFG